MDRDLFRKEVLQAKTAAYAQFGRPSIATHPTWQWFLGVVAVSLISAFFFTAVLEFPRTTNASGQLVYEKKAARVYSGRAGVVEEVFVREGERVKEGDPLLMISRFEGMPNGIEFSVESQAALDLQLGALENRNQAIEQSKEVSIAQLQAEYRAAQIERKQEIQAVDWLSERQEELELRMESYKGFLEEGLVAEVSLDAQIDAFQLNRQRLLEARKRLAAVNARLPDIEMQIERVSLDAQRQIADTNERIAQIIGQKNSLEFDNKFLVLAPANGIVTALQAQAGLQARPDQLVLILAPADSSLIAEVHIHSSAIAFVTPDQRVRLSYTAFPQQRSRDAHGYVRSISATTLTSIDLGEAAPEGLFYKAIVELNEQHVPAFGQNVPLQSGMEVHADIVLEDRKILNWLLDSIRGRT